MKRHVGFIRDLATLDMICCLIPQLLLQLHESVDAPLKSSQALDSLEAVIQNIEKIV